MGVKHVARRGGAVACFHNKVLWRFELTGLTEQRGIMSLLTGHRFQARLSLCPSLALSLALSGGLSHTHCCKLPQCWEGSQEMGNSPWEHRSISGAVQPACFPLNQVSFIYTLQSDTVALTVSLRPVAWSVAKVSNMHRKWICMASWHNGKMSTQLDTPVIFDR